MVIVALATEMNSKAMKIQRVANMESEWSFGPAHRAPTRIIDMEELQTRGQLATQRTGTTSTPRVATTMPPALGREGYCRLL
jgi:hypothetical protein